MAELKQKKKWFTMIEVLLVLMLVSTTFMWIISAVIATTNYLTATRQKVNALNLAKEWVEVMYNIRNTNRRRWDNQKDWTWLKSDPLATAENNETPSTDWMYPWRWIIKTKVATGSNNKYFTLVRIGDWWSLSEEEELQRDASKLQEAIFSWNYLNSAYKLHFLSGNWYNDQDLESFTWEEIAVGEYRRYIAIDWLYKKGNNNHESLDCKKAEDLTNTCWNSDAKELRFCSVVVYTRPKFWTVSICSVITNIEE